MLVSLPRPRDSPKAGTSIPKARIAVRPVTTEKVRRRKRGLASTFQTKICPRLGSQNLPQTRKPPSSTFLATSSSLLAGPASGLKIRNCLKTLTWHQTRANLHIGQIDLKVVAATTVVETQKEWTSRAPRNPNQFIECLQLSESGYHLIICSGCNCLQKVNMNDKGGVPT